MSIGSRCYGLINQLRIYMVWLLLLWEAVVNSCLNLKESPLIGSSLLNYLLSICKQQWIQLLLCLWVHSKDSTWNSCRLHSSRLLGSSKSISYRRTMKLLKPCLLICRRRSDNYHLNNRNRLILMYCLYSMMLYLKSRRQRLILDYHS